jgi:hypothetical protein
VSGTGLPIQLSSNQAVSCGWSFTPRNVTGTMNVAYDLWVHGVSNPGSSSSPTDEIMIWLYRTGGAGPIGAPVGTPVTIAGTTWQLHQGANGSTNVHSFIRTSNATTAVLNMMDFVRNLTSRGSIPSSRYLSSVQAGTEVFIGTGAIDTHGFYCRIQ